MHGVICDVTDLPSLLPENYVLKNCVQLLIDFTPEHCHFLPDVAVPPSMPFQNTLELMMQVEDMAVKLNAYCNDASGGSHQPQPGEVCLAKFSQGILLMLVSYVVLLVAHLMLSICTHVCCYYEGLFLAVGE